MADVIAGLESDLEEAKAVMRSSSNAHASAAKALVRLRTSRDNYITLVENARKHTSGVGGPAAATVKTGDETASDLLSPLLLLLSHKDVPSIGICASLSGVQRLAQAGMLSIADGENVCHVLENLITRRENSIDFKTMQTCAVLARSSGGGSVDVCRRVVNISSSIADEERTKDLAVRKAAIGCLIQITSAVFERASNAASTREEIECAKRLFEELCAVPDKNDSSSAAKAGMGLMRGVALFARNAATATSAIAQGNPAPSRASSLSSASENVWIEPNRICNKDSVEVIDSILSDNFTILHSNSDIAAIVREKCGPTIVNLLKGKYRESTTSGGYGWPLMVRLMRVTRSLLALRNLCGEVISLSLYGELVSMLETENSDVIVTPPWHYILTLETVLATFTSPGFLPFLFRSSILLTGRTVDALSKLIQSWSNPPHDWAEIDFAAREAELNRNEALSKRTRSRGLDLLGDVEPPASFAGPMVVLISTECLVAMLADGGLKDTPTIRVGGLLRKTSAPEPKGEDEDVAVAVRKSVLETTWRPCLAAFSCLLAGCQEEGMVQYVLRAYLSLTTSCGGAGLVEARDAFISSMCKFALPTNFSSHSSALTSFQTSSDGIPVQQQMLRGGIPSVGSSSSIAGTSTKDLTGQSHPHQGGHNHPERLLSHKHLQILKTLFNVAHGLGAILGTSWHIVLETFEQLDLVLHVQNAQQNLANRVGPNDAESEDGQSAAGALAEELDQEEMDAETKMIESMLKNLFETSKYLEDDAVLHLIIALSQMIFTNLAHATTSASSSQSQATSSSTASNVVLSLSSSPVPSKNQPSAPRRLIENFAQSLKTALIQSTASPSQSNLSAHSQQQMIDPDEFRFPPFALDKLVETTELNMERIGALWEVVGSTLLTVASSENDSKIRGFAVKAMEKLVTKVISTQDNATLRRDVVRKFTELVRSPQMDTKDFALQALYRFVSGTGYRLEGLWNLIVAELLIISTTMQSNKQTSAYAFKVVQLIMDDYRPSLDVGCLPSLALCLRAFGEQQNDVNMALTSVHHLWLLCEKGDESLEYSAEAPHVPTKESLQKANALWLHVFHQLRELSLDPRMEVRNSALRSLCTNIVATGDRLTVNSWRTCALDIMLPLIDAVDAKAFSANASAHVLGERLSTHTDMRMTLHHSQDTEEKQWRETRVTALQGTGKIVTSIMQKVEDYRALEWFRELWERLLACVEKALVSNSPARDVVVAAVSVLEELTLLVCGARSRTKYAVPGMRVVNGALVRTPTPQHSPLAPGQIDDEEDEGEDGFQSKKSRNAAITLHIWLWPDIQKVFDRLGSRQPPPFDTDVAALVINIYAELYDSKDCIAARSQESITIFARCCLNWTRFFAKMKNSSKFISPLERNVLKAYGRIPPLEDDDTWVSTVFPQLQALLLSDNETDDVVNAKRPQNRNKSAAGEGDDGGTVQGAEVSPEVVEDEFRTKVRLIYADLFAQAPESVKAGCLREALSRNAIISPQVVTLGLSALRDSGMLADACEDIWMQVLEKSRTDKTILDVLMHDGISMMRRGKVPIAVKESLLRRIEEETVSHLTLFERKAEIIGLFMDVLAIGGGGDKQLAKDLLPSFLVCASEALKHYDHAAFAGLLLARLLDLEIDPENVTDNMRVMSALAQSSALDRGYRKPHLLHLLTELEIAASHAQDVNIRILVTKALCTVATEGWRA